jgi:hypothetical protein
MIPRTSQLRTTNLDLARSNFQRETANVPRNRGEVSIPVRGFRALPLCKPHVRSPLRGSRHGWGENMGSKLFDRNGQLAEEDQFSDKPMMLLKNSIQPQVIDRQKRQNNLRQWSCVGVDGRGIFLAPWRRCWCTSLAVALSGAMLCANGHVFAFDFFDFWGSDDAPASRSSLAQRRVSAGHVGRGERRSLPLWWLRARFHHVCGQRQSCTSGMSAPCSTM